MELVYQKDNAVADDVCEFMINYFESNTDQQFPGKVGGPPRINESMKLTKDMSFSLTGYPKILKPFIDAILSELNICLCDYIHTNNLVLNYENIQVPTIQIQKYTKNTGYYKHHSDDATTGYLTRIITFILYLNDVNEGGETEFLCKHFIKPKTGKIVLFPADWYYIHKGCVPISHDKYIITGWFYL